MECALFGFNRVRTRVFGRMVRVLNARGLLSQTLAAKITR